MKRKLLIFGTGLLSEVLAFYFQHECNERVVAFTVDANYCQGTQYLGVPLIAFEEIVQHCPPSEYTFLVAVGYAKINAVRAARTKQLKELGYAPARFIHPKASIAPNACIGDGCIIFENTVIHPFVRLGENVVIWPQSYIGHHATLGDHCFVGSNASVNGSVTIGECSFIGAGAVVRDFVNVGKRCIIGAGSVCLRHLPDDSLCHSAESPVYLEKTPSMELWPPKVERLF